MTKSLRLVILGWEQQSRASLSVVVVVAAAAVEEEEQRLVLLARLASKGDRQAAVASEEGAAEADDAQFHCVCDLYYRVVEGEGEAAEAAGAPALEGGRAVAAERLGAQQLELSDTHVWDHCAAARDPVALSEAEGVAVVERISPVPLPALPCS